MGKKLGAAVASAALAGSVVASAAGASPLQGPGSAGTAGSDWGSSGHTLCTPGSCAGAVTQGGMVIAWQRVLYAEGLLNACGGTGVDGYFGGVTRFATGTWETWFATVGAADGFVETPSWTQAGLFTRTIGSPPSGPGTRYLYNGAARDVWYRLDGGSYKNDLGGSALHATNHPSMGGYPFC